MGWIVHANNRRNRGTSKNVSESEAGTMESDNGSAKAV
jgi:hypothetical protein